MISPRLITVLVGQFGGEVVNCSTVRIAMSPRAASLITAPILDHRGLDVSVGSSRINRRGLLASAADGELLLLAAGEVAAAAVLHFLQNREQLVDELGYGFLALKTDRPISSFPRRSGGRRSRAPAAHRRCLRARAGAA